MVGVLFLMGEPFGSQVLLMYITQLMCDDGSQAPVHGIIMISKTISSCHRISTLTNSLSPPFPRYIAVILLILQNSRWQRDCRRTQK